MILAFFGHEFTEHELVRLLDTNWEGTEFGKIASIASLGYEVTIASGSQADLRAVCSRGIPLIAAVHTLLLPTYGPPGGAHCVVVAGATDTETAIYDPDRSAAPDVIPAMAFDAAWRRRQYRMAAIAPR